MRKKKEWEIIVFDIGLAYAIPQSKIGKRGFSIDDK